MDLCARRRGEGDTRERWRQWCMRMRRWWSSSGTCLLVRAPTTLNSHERILSPTTKSKTRPSFVHCCSVLINLNLLVVTLHVALPLYLSIFLVVFPRAESLFLSLFVNIFNFQLTQWWMNWDVASLHPIQWVSSSGCLRFQCSLVWNSHPWAP